MQENRIEPRPAKRVPYPKKNYYKKTQNMKAIIYFFIIFTILLCNSGYARAQNNVEDKQAIQMLKEFYIAYNAAWSAAKGEIPMKKLRSLQRKYCTSKLINAIKDEDFDHDPLLGEDYEYVEHLNTVTVIKDRNKGNTYIVSYIDHTTQGGNPIDIKVVLHVILVKEGGSFKIASVKETAK
jgi:hypothetical protein